MDRTLEPIDYGVENTQLANFARALAHPVRIQIIQLLKSQSSCYTGDLTEMIPLAQSTISQHLKVLKEAGLIKGEILPPKVKYCIDQTNWLLAGESFEELFK